MATCNGRATVYGYVFSPDQSVWHQLCNHWLDIWQHHSLSHWLPLIMVSLLPVNRQQLFTDCIIKIIHSVASYSVYIDIIWLTILCSYIAITQ